VNTGDMVEWWNAHKMEGAIGLIIRLDERSGRPGAWIMWNNGKHPMWSPLCMLATFKKDKVSSK
jgi:hypothetical protein